MKYKILGLVSAVAIITLSFTFSSKADERTNSTDQTPKRSVETPVGGLLSESKL